MMSGAWAVGTAVAFTPNFQKGVVAAAKLLKLLARQPTIKDGSNTMPLSTVSHTFLVPILLKTLFLLFFYRKKLILTMIKSTLLIQLAEKQRS